MTRFGKARRALGKNRPFERRHFRTAIGMTDDANARAERIFIPRDLVGDEAFGREFVCGGRLIRVVVGVVKGFVDFDPKAPVEDVSLGVGERNVERSRASSSPLGSVRVRKAPRGDPGASS